MVTTWITLLLASMVSDGVKMNFISSGATQKTGGFRPYRAEMDKSADLVRVPPADLENPKYGELEIGEKTWMFILDEPTEGAENPARLFVDTNGDGDFTNDPETSWASKETNGSTMFEGKAQIDLGNGRLGSLGLYRFDPNDERRTAFANTMMYYHDFGYEVTVTLDGQEFTSFIAGDFSDSTRLTVDRDGNGRISSKRETVTVGKPFNFTGTTYMLKLDAGEVSLVEAEESLPLMPLPPDTSLGKTAIPFKATTMDTTEINFPETYAGKIVMLDFWATWCGPCIGELPHMKKAYADWHDQGFEILGVSFDREEMEEKLTEFFETREMPWPQIYEGKGWNTSIGELYDVSGIPFVLLVDGSTGEILGTSRELRGKGLSKFVGSIIKQRSGAATEESDDESEDQQDDDPDQNR